MGLVWDQIRLCMTDEVLNHGILRRTSWKGCSLDFLQYCTQYVVLTHWHQLMNGLGLSLSLFQYICFDTIRLLSLSFFFFLTSTDRIALIDDFTSHISAFSSNQP